MSDKNERPETLANIAREMRDPNSGLCRWYADGGNCDCPKCVFDALADRIEAAAMRERDATPGNAAAKWLYRLEYHDGTCGLWYDGSGNWCFERGIGSLDDSCKTKSLPMDYDERYRQDGRSWFSSCSRKEDLLHWYSREDAKRLLSHGFVFTRYLATEYREYDQQTVFIKETCLYREEIDFESLWKSSAPGNAAAMREALEAVQCWFDNGMDGDDEQEMDTMLDQVAAALSAPARNCDRFEDALDARAEWDRIAPLEEGDAFDWLYDPAGGGAE